MGRVRIIPIIILLFTAPLLAAPELAMDISSFVTSKGREHLNDAFYFALNHVRLLPPAEGNPFEAPTDRILHFYLTTSQDPVAPKAIAELNELTGFPQTSDAFTTTGMTPYFPGIIFTTVTLLVDKICFDPTSGAIRKDAFVRMLTALAHEIYGNVPVHLEMPDNLIPEKPTLQERRAEEITAFLAGIAFLERYLKSELLNGLFPETRGQVEQALEREKEGLASWRKCSVTVATKSKKKKKE